LTAEIIGGVCTPSFFSHPWNHWQSTPFKFRIGNPTSQQTKGIGAESNIHGRVVGSKDRSIRLSYERKLIKPIYPNMPTCQTSSAAFLRIGKKHEGLGG
jgi:hypothetical protein